MHNELNLDDRTFRELLHNARTALHEHTQEWTDHNDHDPGITILEMLSWVTEIQQYYLNQVTVKSQRRFLELLGFAPRQGVPAKTQVVLTGEKLPPIVRAGTRMFAGRVVFEASETQVLPDVMLTTLGVWDGDRFARVETESINGPGAIHPFGRYPTVDSALYVGFDSPLPAAESVALFISLMHDYPVNCNRIPRGDSSFVPPVEIEWSFFSVSGWQVVDVIEDETYRFAQSGTLRFRVGDMVRHRIAPLGTEGYWLRAVVREGTFDLVPQMKYMSLHAVDVIQTDTQADIFASDSKSNSLIVEHSLISHGMVIYQEGIGIGQWRDIDIEESNSYVKEETAAHVTLSCSTSDTFTRLRAVACTPDFALLRVVGATTGLPLQRLQAPVPAVPGMILSICENDLWEDWLLVDDFDVSGPDDRHFMYDAEDGTFVFGDNEHGRCPLKSNIPNVRIIRYQTTLGVVGNIQPEQIDTIWLADDRWAEQISRVTNFDPGIGGKNAETVTDAQLRLRGEWMEPKAAITDADWERLVKSTPGVRVARVKVLPLYQPMLKDYPMKTAPNHLSIVVVPYSESPAPRSSEALLKTIRHHIEPHRLLTTVLHVIAPTYVTVMVHATIIMEPYAVNTQSEILRELTSFLSPGASVFGGWSFGKTVYRADLMNLIAGQSGVVFVQDLTLEAYGNDVNRDADGNIRISPSSLVVSDTHNLNLVSRLDL